MRSVCRHARVRQTTTNCQVMIVVVIVGVGIVGVQVAWHADRCRHHIVMVMTAAAACRRVVAAIQAAHWLTAQHRVGPAVFAHTRTNRFPF